MHGCAVSPDGLHFRFLTTVTRDHEGNGDRPCVDDHSQAEDQASGKAAGVVVVGHVGDAMKSGLEGP